LYSEGKENGREREEGKVAMDVRRKVEDVAG
jgi:hypothetical protein